MPKVNEEQNLGVLSGQPLKDISSDAAPSTPRPWSLDIEEEEGSHWRNLSIREINRMIHDSEWADPKDWERDLANAELIVHCVNLFPTMIAALQKIYDCGSIREAEQVAASALALARGSVPERETETQQG